MQEIVRNVRDIDVADRAALEHLLGQPLHENQQIAVSVHTVDGPPARENGTGSNVALPSWCDVYAGLSDEEIEQLDSAIRERADLTRTHD